MSVPETVELSDTERLGAAGLRSTIERIRLAATFNAVVKFSPDAALALAELIEKLAGAAGIELPDASEPAP